MFDGAANLDEVTMPHLSAMGATLRLFDRETGRWLLNWASSVSGTLFPPVFGRFEAGRGEFYGDDRRDGQDVRVRFVWSGIRPRRPAGSRRSPSTARTPG
ncbi:hypothetical protein ABZ499_19310 [Streptomyces sp. NPDC019990]|uniref:hypothetical protein n=1 Tax=Streptomyces sp. NPDC019990 TaxID=3154693 RepID=UPI0033EDF275